MAFQAFLGSLPLKFKQTCVIFQEACHLCYTFTSFNTVYGDTFGKQYFDQDWLNADVIRHFQCQPRSIQLLRSEQVQISEMLYTIATA